MISTELLRRYPFFAQLRDDQLVKLAMISQEVEFVAEETILEEHQAAQHLYFLLEGDVVLYYLVEPGHKEIPVSHINIGEPFGISALIEPYVYTATARSKNGSRAMCIDATQLRQVFQEDPQLEILMLQRVAKAALERLHATRLQLAAAWA